MAESPQPVLTRVRNRVRNRLMSGMLVLVPLGVTLLVMRWLFEWMAGFLQPVVIRALEHLPIPLERLPGVGPSAATSPAVPGPAAVPPPAIDYPLYVDIPVSIVSILILLAFLYVVGVIGQLVLGRRAIAAGETILLRIPFARTIYGATKQVMEAVSLPNRGAFQAVVLVEFPRPGWKALGFLTGTLRDSKGSLYARVFIPTTPNPTTGYFEIVPAGDVVQTSLTFEEAFKMIMSGGILCPEVLDLAHPTIAELETQKARLPAQPAGDGEQTPVLERAPTA